MSYIVKPSRPRDPAKPPTNLSAQELQTIMEHITTCKNFSIDTESDRNTRELALIQIHTIPSRLPGIVILLELFHLPLVDTILFQQIYSLVQLIFYSALSYINLQRRFKPWIEGILPHSEECQSEHINPQPYRCDCIPHIGTTETWSLQNAVRYACSQFLDKSCTKSRWKKLLDPLYSTLASSTLNNMIYYVIYDVLAVSYLRRPVLESWDLDQLRKATIASLLTVPLFTFGELEDISDDDINDTEQTSTLHLINEPQIADELIIQADDVNLLSDETTALQSLPTQLLSTKVRFRSCRSIQSRTKRNKKRNTTRRLFRYRHVIRRALYRKFPMFMVKMILRKLHIHFVHVNRDVNELIIGIKSERLRAQYEEQIPMNLFDRNHYIHAKQSIM
ncbi:unnamed protein product [Rotaria sordida]|uniref:Uncharacterized protein n=1 Tax=Rotaria sordida TaxID=392033 RepID=A0A816DI08_9BILA|nr:unnamed protein product [Rotaria sordida]CAF1634970.1 unnamed protein product [Rotaria sordida]